MTGLAAKELKELNGATGNSSTDAIPVTGDSDSIDIEDVDEDKELAVNSAIAVEKEGKDGGMAVYYFLFKPLAGATKRRQGGLAHDGMGVGKTSVNKRPKLAHMRSDKFRATLESDCEGSESRLALARFVRSHVLRDDGMEGWENLSGRKRCSKLVDDTESSLGAMSVRGYIYKQVHSPLMGTRRQYPQYLPRFQ